MKSKLLSIFFALLCTLQAISAPPTANLAARYIAGVGITHGTGSFVAQWDDQSGSGNHLVQATGSAQPTDTLDPFGVPIVSFPMVNSVNGDRRMLSASPALNSRACSAWVIGRTATGAGQSFVTINGSALGAFLRQFGSASIAPSLYGVSRQTSLRAPCNRGLWGLVSGVSGATVHTAYESTSVTAVTNATGTGGVEIGAATGTLFAAMDVYEILIYSAEQSAPDIAAVKAYAIAAYGLNSGYTKQLVCNGDSITRGNNTTPSNAGYPFQLANNASIAANWRVTNLGVSGDTIAAMTTRAGASDAMLVGSGYTRQVFLVMIGRNDIATLTPAQVYSALVTYCQARVAAGWEVWVGTCIATGNSTYEANLTTLNGLIRAGMTTDAPGVTRIVDFAASPVFDAGSSGDTTYYQTDFTHLTIAGYGVMASMVTPYLLTNVAPSSFFFAQSRLPYIPFNRERLWSRD